MTGFGSATRTREGLSVTVEARSVNNRFLKVSIRGPSRLFSREPEIEALVRERVARGSLHLTLRLDREESPVKVRMNESALAEYLRLFARIEREREEVQARPTLEVLALLPGLFEAEEIEADLPEDEWRVVREAVAAAMDDLVEMREREGENLARDFRARRSRIADLVEGIRGRLPGVAEAQLERLAARVDRLLERRETGLEEKDLLREIALLADRSDVTEEVTRLESHLDQVGRALEEEGELGRRLEFLAQEMFREVNTIAAKSPDVEISHLSVDLKVELDRLKEQVQNVE